MLFRHAWYSVLLATQLGPLGCGQAPEQPGTVLTAISSLPTSGPSMSIGMSQPIPAAPATFAASATAAPSSSASPGDSAGPGGSAGPTGSAAPTSLPSAAGTAAPVGTKVTVLSDCKIATPTQWSSGVYVANCVLEVSSTLTLDPGTVIKFGPGAYVNVLAAGALVAKGTEAQPIVFTSFKDDAHGGDTNADGASLAARNDWGCQDACGGLNIQGKGSALEFVQVLYASSGTYVQAESVSIRNSVFAHQNNYGLVLDGRFPVGMTELNANAFFDNNGFPLQLGKSVFLDASNVFHDPAHPEVKNVKQCVELTTDLDSLIVLGVTEVAFLLSDRHVSGEVLTPPGVVFKAQNKAIYLDASGSFFNGPNVIFTSYKDDSLGGDCTGDGATQAAAGDWEGLWIEDASGADYAAAIDYIRFAAKTGVKVLH